VLPLIEDLPNAMERDTYRQALSRMLRVDERSLLSSQVQGPVAKRKSRGVEQSHKVVSSGIVAVNPTLKIESYCLGVLLRKPELLYRLDKRMQEADLTALAVEDFEYTDHQLLFDVVRMAVEQDEKDYHHYVMTHVPESVSDLSKELVARSDNLDPVEDKVLDDLLARFMDLRRANAMLNVNQLRFLQEEDQQQGGANMKLYQEQTLQMTRLLHSLDQAKRKLSSKR
jgi:DNA primase